MGPSELLKAVRCPSFSAAAAQEDHGPWGEGGRGEGRGGGGGEPAADEQDTVLTDEIMKAVS